MLENFIYIENVKESDIIKALQDLADLYSDTGYTDEIILYRKKDRYDSFSVTFSNLPDFDRFSYFVNYLYLPFDLDDFEPQVRGFYQVKNITQNLEFKTGDWVMLFMTKNHTKSDEVSVVNEKNENYNFDFGGNAKKINRKLKEFHFENLDLTNYYSVKHINPDLKKKSLKIDVKPWWKFW